MVDWVERNAINKLYHRLLSVIGRGKITLVVDGGNVQKTQVQLGVDEVIDNLPRLSEFGLASNPPVGSDAVVVFIGGDRSNGAVIATGNQVYRFYTSPGETAIYDAFGKSIYLSENGIVVNANGQDVAVNNAAAVVVNSTSITLNSTGDVNINAPALKVSGDIIDNSGSNPHSIANMRALYDVHYHGGVMSGGSDTDPPNNSM